MSDLRPPRTIKDLQSVTGLGRDACKAAVLSGQLPGYKVGSRYVIPADAFDALCAGTWTPQPREITITNITPLVRRKSA